MQSQVEQVLKDVGPCLSSVAAAELRKRYGLSEPAARQRIARRQHPVQHLELPFRHRATFLYLSNQYQTPAFLHALADALEANNGAYARTLQALGARGGVMPLAHLSSAAGLSDTTAQLGAQEVLERLVNARVLTEVEVPGLGPCVAFRGTDERDEPLQNMKARLVAEDVLLEAFKQWARNLALGSFNSFKLRGSEVSPLVGRFQWDLTVPSYVSGLSSWDVTAKKPKPGFLVADVLLGRAVDERALRPFIYKCKTLPRTGSHRCMQFFLAEGFTHGALMELRKNGIVPARVEELFGRGVAEGLRELISTLTQTAARAVEPEKFDVLFSSLGRFEAAAGRLRGALFEFVAAALLRELGYQDILINKVYRDGGRDLAEVDVRARFADEILFVECKGILPGTVLDDKEVDEWLNRRVPAIAARARQNEEYANHRFTFELWTTGELSDTGWEMLSAKKRAVRQTKYTLGVLQGPELEKRAIPHSRNQPALLKVLQAHFLRSPLSKEARDVQHRGATLCHEAS